MLYQYTIVKIHFYIGIDNTWEKEGTLSEYIDKAKSQGITESLLMPVPNANLMLYQSISACKDSDIKLHFVPLVHPVLDTIDYLEQLIIFFRPVVNMDKICFDLDYPWNVVSYDNQLAVEVTMIIFIVTFTANKLLIL